MLIVGEVFHAETVRRLLLGENSGFDNFVKRATTESTVEGTKTHP